MTSFQCFEKKLDKNVYKCTQRHIIRELINLIIIKCKSLLNALVDRSIHSSGLSEITRHHYNSMDT